MSADSTRCQFKYQDPDSFCPHLVVENDLCLFHLPKLTEKEKAGLREVERRRMERMEAEFLEKFFNFLFSNNYNDRVEEIDCRGFQFPEIEMGRLQEYKRSIDFEGAVFAGRVTFDHCLFNRGVSFRKTRFKDVASFNGAYFQRKLYSFAEMYKKSAPTPAETDSVEIYKNIFDIVIFDSDVYFNETEFVGQIIAHFPEFGGKAEFFKVQFANDCTLIEPKFKSHVRFSDCHFHSRVTILSDVDNFSVQKKEDSATFNEQTGFTNTVFYKDLTIKAKFANNVTFVDCRFKGKTIFRGTVFAGEATFSSVEAGGSFLGECDFRDWR